VGWQQSLEGWGRFWLLQKDLVGRSVEEGGTGTRRGGLFGGCDGDGELLAGEAAAARRYRSNLPVAPLLRLIKYLANTELGPEI